MGNHFVNIRFVNTRNHNRRGASEVLGALIIAVIAIAGFTAYAGTLFNQTRVETSSITEALRKGTIKQGQLLTTLYHWESIEGTQTRIEVTIYNYGYTDAKPKLILIDTQPYKNYQLTDLDGNPVDAIKPGQISKIILTAPYVAQSVLSSQGYELVLLTEDNQAYSWWL
ncbi:MAG: hypothetical protein M1503_02395 [Thaumarchaeota archaeon]|nr:hypothetical protein [Nitrososphaerota archaeon]MCL5317102.1 hypothetical protein [Nitrososphaerota archaeon]